MLDDRDRDAERAARALAHRVGSALTPVRPPVAHRAGTAPRCGRLRASAGRRAALRSDRIPRSAGPVRERLALGVLQVHGDRLVTAQVHGLLPGIDDER